MQHKNYLDAVRAFSAALVITVHTSQFFQPHARILVIWASLGQLGVQLFFVASAFLIFDSLERIAKRGGTLTEFFIHRVLRIAPLYWFAIFMFVLVFGAIFPALHWSAHAPEAYTTENIVANVLLLHGLLPSANNSIVGGGWSIGTEFIFYVLAPTMFALRRRPGLLVVLALACFPLVYAATRIIQPALGESEIVPANGFLYYSILNQMPVFVCGALLFVFRDWLFKMRTAWAVAGWLGFTAATYWIWTRYFGSRMTFAFVPALIGVASVYFIVTMSKVSYVPRIVSTFGQRSFSIYLFNFPVLIVLNHLATRNHLTISFYVALPIVASAAYLGAGITYRLIEKPGIQFAKRFNARGATSEARQPLA